VSRLRKETQEAAEALNKALLETDVIVEYKKYEQVIREDHELAVLEKELKELQQELLKKKALDEDIYSLMEDYEKKRKVFENHPLVVNYRNLKQDVNDLLIEVESIINTDLIKTID